jgi:hypothetical protein
MRFCAVLGMEEVGPIVAFRLRLHCNTEVSHIYTCMTLTLLLLLLYVFNFDS